MTHRILITGAGGPAAVGVLRTISSSGYEFWAADMSPEAVGLYLVPEPRRSIILPGDHPNFVSQLLDLCRRHKIDLVWPTVDAELEALADARELFARCGIQLLVPETGPLSRTLDKWRLYEVCRDVMPCPFTQRWSPERNAGAMKGRVVLKPRRGSGSRGIHVVGPGEAVPTGLDDYLLQEELPGAEYSVDTFVSRVTGAAIAVPRLRCRVDSGVAVAAETVRDPHLQALAVTAMNALGLTGVANVQFRRDSCGHARLLEVNPRVAGTMVLSVRAGVDLFHLALADALGKQIKVPTDFAEIGVVRHLSEQYVSRQELERLRQSQRTLLAARDLSDEEAA